MKLVGYIQINVMASPLFLPKIVGNFHLQSKELGEKAELEDCPISQIHGFIFFRTKLA